MLIMMKIIDNNDNDDEYDGDDIVNGTVQRKYYHVFFLSLL